jgi:hypothetical protein
MSILNRTLMTLAICMATTITCMGQSASQEMVTDKKELRPFKVLTSGKQITIRSTKEIRSIMLWTASGHRILEEKEINVSTYNFRITNNIPDKIFFLMIQLQNGKVFTEKVGLQ